MSKENVQKFKEFIAQDVEARNELNARITAVTIEFAAEKGFEFTAEEQGELSDEDLDNVNGGLPIMDLFAREWNEKRRARKK